MVNFVLNHIIYNMEPLYRLERVSENTIYSWMSCLYTVQVSPTSRQELLPNYTSLLRAGLRGQNVLRSAGEKQTLIRLLQKHRYTHVIEWV